jgi:hypothetical protein
MVANLQMMHIAKLGRIRSNVETGRRIRIQFIRLRAGKTQESNHVLGVINLLADDTSGHKFRRARRVDNNGLFQGPPQDRDAIQIDNILAAHSLFSNASSKGSIAIGNQGIT